MSISTTTFDELEAQVRTIVNDPAALQREWTALDFNGNGHVSLAEIDRWVQEAYPALNNKSALMRAYKKTTQGGNKNDFVEKPEFIQLLRNLFYYNRLWEIFDQIDSSDDKRVDFEEFKKGVALLNLNLSEDEAKQSFNTIDTNSGGFILFDEFCSWVVQTKMPVD
jgi:hypothetical protein